jgi:hypothetical protein
MNWPDDRLDFRTGSQGLSNGRRRLPSDSHPRAGQAGILLHPNRPARGLTVQANFSLSRKSGIAKQNRSVFSHVIS